MLTFKNKKETETELKHIDVFNKRIYLGYIIKTDKWYFTRAKKDNNLYDTSKGYYSSLEAKTKKELISIIENKNS